MKPSLSQRGQNVGRGFVPHPVDWKPDRRYGTVYTQAEGEPRRMWAIRWSALEIREALRRIDRERNQE